MHIYNLIRVKTILFNIGMALDLFKSFIGMGRTKEPLLYGVRKCSSFILLQVVDQFSQNHLLKRLTFFHCISLPPLSKIRLP